MKKPKMTPEKLLKEAHWVLEAAGTYLENGVLELAAINFREVAELLDQATEIKEDRRLKILRRKEG